MLTFAQEHWVRRHAGLGRSTIPARGRTGRNQDEIPAGRPGRSAGNQTSIRLGRVDREIGRDSPSATPPTTQPLPHLDTIERSFGPGHNLSSVRAHVGG